MPPSENNDASLRFLFKAAIGGDLAAVQRASLDPTLDLGALVGPNGRTLLHFAAHGDQPKIIEFLLDRCDANKLCNLGDTALMTATRFGHFLSVQKLAPKTNLNAANSEGKTALMIAAFEGEYGCAQMLANDHAAKRKNIYGQTALMISIIRENWHCASVLLPYSDLAAKDNNGKTALWHALVNEKWDFADTLASKTSTKDALFLRNAAPKEVELPLSQAVIERAELAKVVKAANRRAASASSASASLSAKASSVSNAEGVAGPQAQSERRRVRRV